MFIGRVVQIERKTEDTRQQRASIGLPTSYRVRFEVKTGFRGVTARELTVETGMGGGDCGYGFETGRDYVVFAQGDSFYTGICSGTRPLGKSDGIEQELRSTANAPPGATLSGNVFGPGETSSPKPKALAGIRVTATGPSSQSAVTDASGHYEIHNLAEGRYQVNAELPSDLQLSSNEALVPERGCAEINLYARPHTRIRGRIVDIKGKAIAHVGISVAPWDAQGQRITRYSGESDENGNFEVDSLSPGKYLVAAGLTNLTNRGEKVYKPQFYPNAESRETATAVVVTPGSKTEDIDFALDGPLRPRKIRIAVVLPDGKPATKGFVQYVPSDYPMNLLRPGSLDVEGIAEIEVLENTEYSVCAHVSSAMGEPFHSDTITVRGTATEQQLPRLVAETPGREQCSNWPK